jgi:hypothetical protein
LPQEVKSQMFVAVLHTVLGAPATWLQTWPGQHGPSKTPQGSQMLEALE